MASETVFSRLSDHFPSGKISKGQETLGENNKPDLEVTVHTIGGKSWLALVVNEVGGWISVLQEYRVSQGDGDYAEALANIREDAAAFTEIVVGRGYKVRNRTDTVQPGGI